MDDRGRSRCELMESDDAGLSRTTKVTAHKGVVNHGIARGEKGMPSRSQKRSKRKTKSQSREKREYVLSIRLSQDFVDMLERAGSQYVLPGEKPLSASQVALLLLEWEMNRNMEDQNRTIAEIIRRMEALQRARKKRKK